MLVDAILNRFADHVTRRYVVLQEHDPVPPPSADPGRTYMLYVHIPFCEELCPFCSFNRVEFESSLAQAYFVALRRELLLYKELGYNFDVLYFGGGTPTVMPDELLALGRFIREHWEIKRLSIETNPNHLNAEVVAVLHKLGVDRLSVGVQSFDDHILTTIGRREKYGSGDEIRERLQTVAGEFATLNIDMIFNFPAQTREQLEHDIAAVNSSGVDQVTYYPLMMPEARREELFSAAGRGSMDNREKAFYRLIVEGMSDAYQQESVWCFSRQGGMLDEYIVEHDQYAGAGSGSFGYVDGLMYSNTLSIGNYIESMKGDRAAVVASRQYSPAEQMHYDFLIKLLDGSLEISCLKAKYGRFLRSSLTPKWMMLWLLGSLRIRRGRFVLTPRGKYHWVIFLRTLFTVAGAYREARMLRDNVD